MHWHRLVKNIGWANQNIGGWQKVVKSEKSMGDSQLLKGTCPGCPPKSTPMSIWQAHLWLQLAGICLCPMSNTPKV